MLEMHYPSSGAFRTPRCSPERSPHAWPLVYVLLRGSPGAGHEVGTGPPRPSDPLPPQPSREGCVRRSGWHRAPGRGERLVLRWGGRQPPRGSSLLFYKYLYFFVARYCYLTLVRGSRDVLAAPRGSAVSVCPSQAGLGLPAPPAPVCAAELYTLSFFSDVIFKTSDMPVYEDIAGNTHGQVFVFYT